MFGLKAFFAALSRLAAEVNRSADLFAEANARLAERLGFEEPAPALPHVENGEEEKPARNGRSKAK